MHWTSINLVIPVTHPTLQMSLGYMKHITAHLLALLAEHLQHTGLVHLIKGDIGKRVKQATLEVGYHAGGITAQGQYLQ